jgi:hypothetical protein
VRLAIQETIEAHGPTHQRRWLLRPALDAGERNDQEHDNDQGQDHTNADEDLVDLVALFGEGRVLVNRPRLFGGGLDLDTGRTGLIDLFLAGLVAKFNHSQSQRLPRLERAFLDRIAVDKRAVSRVEVFDENLVAFESQLAVVARDTWLRQAVLVVIKTADRGLLGRHFENTTTKAFGDDDQFCHIWFDELNSRSTKRESNGFPELST